MNLKDIKKKADEVRLRNQTSIQNIESPVKEEVPDADELFEIGLHYYLGNDGYEEDNAKAFDYFSKASELGNPFASSCLGEMYFKGFHVSKNISEAKRYLQIGVDNEVVLAMTNLADLYREEENKDGDAFNLYNKATSYDNAYSQWMLGQYYYYGIATDKDDNKAERLYLKAAEKDDRAYFSLGELYESQSRYEEAFDWYKKSADAGYYAGMANLGWAYMLGYGVDENFGTAKVWFEKAEEGNNAVAQFGLGILYENGWGCPPDKRLAMSYYQKAADNGHENAQKAIQYNGYNNVPRENSNRGISLSDIQSRVVSIIVDKLGVYEEEVTNDASFSNDLGADSLDTVELIMEFEKEFGVTIPDEEAETISTVGDAIDYLVEKLK